MFAVSSARAHATHSSLVQAPAAAASRRSTDCLVVLCSAAERRRRGAVRQSEVAARADCGGSHEASPHGSLKEYKEAPDLRGGRTVVLKWLKQAKNKSIDVILTKFSKQVSADSNNFRFRSLQALHIPDISPHWDFELLSGSNP